MYMQRHACKRRGRHEVKMQEKCIERQDQEVSRVSVQGMIINNKGHPVSVMVCHISLWKMPDSGNRHNSNRQQPFHLSITLGAASSAPSHAHA